MVSYLKPKWESIWKSIWQMHKKKGLLFLHLPITVLSVWRVPRLPTHNHAVACLGECPTRAGLQQSLWISPSSGNSVIVFCFSPFTCHLCPKVPDVTLLLNIWVSLASHRTTFPRKYSWLSRFQSICASWQLAGCYFMDIKQKRGRRNDSLELAIDLITLLLGMENFMKKLGKMRFGEFDGCLRKVLPSRLANSNKGELMV